MQTSNISKKLLAAVPLAAIFCGIAAAQSLQPIGSLPPMVQGVGIDQNLNSQVPLDLTFTDDAGQNVRLGQYFRSKPVVLTMVYYECPMLCDQILNGVTHAMEQISLNLGSDFEVVSVSFNPAETWQLASAKKANYVQKYQRSGAAQGWHFLTGNQENIKKLAEAVGFHYKYDPITKQFAHASGIMILTPDGKIARYFYGINYQPRDFRLGLVEASNNKIGSPTDEILLFCFHYNPATGKYGLIIQNVTRALGSATVVLLGGFVFLMLRRDRRSKQSGAGRFA